MSTKTIAFIHFDDTAAPINHRLVDVSVTDLNRLGHEHFDAIIYVPHSNPELNRQFLARVEAIKNANTSIVEVIAPNQPSPHYWQTAVEEAIPKAIAQLAINASESHLRHPKETMHLGRQMPPVDPAATSMRSSLLLSASTQGHPPVNPYGPLAMVPYNPSNLVTPPKNP